MSKFEYCTVNFNLDEGMVRATYLTTDGNHQHVDLLNGEPIAFDDLDKTRYQIVAHLGDNGWQLASIFNASLYYFIRQVDQLIPVSTSSATVEQPGIDLNRDTYKLRYAGQEMQLTPTETRLLAYLLDNPNRVLSPSLLLRELWEYPPNTGDSDLVRAHIRNLEAKLGRIRGLEKSVRTIHGVGYMFSL